MRAFDVRSFGVIGLLAILATPARADFNVATGLQWVPGSYTVPVGAGSPGLAALSDGSGWYQKTGDSLYGFQTTSLKSYVAFFFTEQIGLHLSLDLGWSGHSAGTFSTSFLQIGVGAGAKFYLTRPARDRIAPYLFANVFKYFSTVDTNDTTVTAVEKSALQDFHAPFGFHTAFGAEYFVSPGFSIGAEILGLRFAHIESDVPTVGGNRVHMSDNEISFYAGVSLNYRFLFAASVSMSVRQHEEDEASGTSAPPRSRPKRRPRDEAGTGNGPPPSPEPVD